MTITEKIKSRGYWSVRIRPEIYEPDQALTLERLQAAVTASSVNVRGWDLPHISFNDQFTRMPDFVEQGTDWAHYIELWRAYRSKQFAFIKAMPEDWFDQQETAILFQPPADWKPRTLLYLEDTVFRLAEIFEFASRWATTLNLGGSLVVEIQLEGLAGRELRTDGARRMPFRIAKKCEAPRWTLSLREPSIPIADLVSSTRDLAAGAAASLFELFHWDVRPEAIREIQMELPRLR